MKYNEAKEKIIKLGLTFFEAGSFFENEQNWLVQSKETYKCSPYGHESKKLISCTHGTLQESKDF